MPVIDGVVIPVPEGNRAAYRKKAKQMAALFVACGASEVVDAWGFDVPEGKMTSFPMAVKVKPGESVVFGWVVWPTKSARDKGWKKAMQDPLMSQMTPDLFDGKRMIFGAFEVIQSTRKEG
jgi:uncharacterized protein YbaA (DUF1428 family)